MKTRLSLLAGVLQPCPDRRGLRRLESEEPTETTAQGAAAGGVVTLRVARSSSPSCCRIPAWQVFDQANQGAQEAAKELGVDAAQFLGEPRTTASPGRSRS